MNRAKTFLVVALVAIFGCLQANAGGFRFGVKAGMNVNSMHLNKSMFDSDNQCGFTVGAMTEFTIPVIGLGVDLSVMYARMNNESTVTESTADDGTVVTETVNYGKNFIEIPLNLKYKFSLPIISSVASPYIYTGPTVALKLDGGENNSFKAKTAQVGWNLGVGFELVNHLQIGAGYTFGINNVVKSINPTSYQLQDLKAKNNYWTITAAWLF